VTFVGLARNIRTRCMYGICGRDFIRYTVIHGEYIRFRPTLGIIELRTQVRLHLNSNNNWAFITQNIDNPGIGTDSFLSKLNVLSLIYKSPEVRFTHLHGC